MATFIALYQKDFGKFVDKSPSVYQIIEEFAPVAQVDAENIEDAWMIMQAPCWSPNGEASPRIKELGLQHTSMSMGDVFYNVEKGTFHFCRMVGWSGPSVYIPRIRKHFQEVAKNMTCTATKRMWEGEPF